jgi:EAL domain-containing protein (putative c-di-GMP-specific phosphodiesterase class I)
MVARLGGDEFVVLLEGVASAADLSAITQKMLVTIGEPLVILGCTFLVTGSIGIAQYPADGRDAATLLRYADAAMYLAKSKGKNNIQRYSAELADTAAKQFDVESALRLALTRDELLLHYQPKVGMTGGRLLGVEALVRWMHPTRGMVPPAEFVPVAEERGLIIPLGRWVIREVCRQIRDWRRAGLIAPPVAVNLSAWQFTDKDLVTDIGDAMAQYGVGAAEFEVELTESVLMTDPERANAVLQRLHRMGVKISIDDFGTGYSSLSYLKRFPADALKIDRSFICGLPGDADDRAITQAVIAMAHALGLKVVAEGVETDAQLVLLRALGCDEAQGYLLGKPMPAAQIASRLQFIAAAAHGVGKNLAVAGK